MKKCNILCYHNDTFLLQCYHKQRSFQFPNQKKWSNEIFYRYSEIVYASNELLDKTDISNESFDKTNISNESLDKISRICLNIRWINGNLDDKLSRIRKVSYQTIAKKMFLCCWKSNCCWNLHIKFKNSGLLTH